VDLSSFAGSEILLQFQTTNRKGNNIYLDNVKVYAGTQEPMTIDEQALQVLVYPNPASDVVNFVFDKNRSYTNVQIFDSSGRLISVPHTLHSDRISLNVEGLSSGIYFASLVSKNNASVVRVSVAKK
jgi:hypothetical protein